MSEPSLFEEESPPPPPKKQKKPVENDGSLKWLMFGVYYPLYVEKYREEPLINKKHFAQLKRVLDQFGPQVVEQRLRMFFVFNDEFVRTAGHAIGVFISVWAKLAAEEAKHRMTLTHGGTVRVRCQHTPPCRSVSEHSRRMVESLRTPATNAYSRTTSKPSDPF